MHGRGSQASTPASDVATREGRRRPRVRATSDRVVPRGKSRIGSMRANAAEIGADAAEIGADGVRIGPTRSVSARLGPYRPVSAETTESGWNSKKKKKVQTHHLTNLNTQTPLRPSHFVQNSQTPSLTPSLKLMSCILIS